MKVCCISDTHLTSHPIVALDTDIVIHSGDATMNGTVEEVIKFANWFKTLPGIKLFVPGNHDFLFEREEYLARDLLRDPKIHVLINQQYIHKTLAKEITFWGTPVQPEYHGWAFNVKEDAKRALYFSAIPDGTHFLITHGPAFGILDKNKAKKQCGDEELLKKIKKLPNLLYHQFGHIHESHGQIEIDNVLYINASHCGIPYWQTNPPIYIEI